MNGGNTAWTGRRIMLGVALLLWLGACYGLRFGVMESRGVADACLRDGGDWLCTLRAVLGGWIYFRCFGIAALLLVLAANLARGAPRRFLAPAALFAAAAALVLYNVDFGAPAAVFALLTLADPRIARG